MRPLRVPLHPFLFALFPLVSLYARNSGILGPRSLVAPIACALLIAALLLAAGSWLLGDRLRAAAATSLIVLSVFLYPTLIGAMAMLWLPSNALCVLLWSAAVIAGVTAIARSRRDLAPLTRSLDVMALVALAVPLIGVAPTLWSEAAAAPAAAAPRSAAVAKPDAPDVYYIILDGYARQDVLAEYYGFDNSEFIDALRRRGFYVAPESRSNYAQTYLSLASSLNQTYLDEVVQRLGASSEDRQPLGEMIADSRAVQILRRHGYSFVSFASGYTGTEIPGADVYIDSPLSLTEFQHLLFDSTPLAALSQLLVGADVRFAAHRNRVLHTLDGLAEPLPGKGPRFVFAHVYAPHPPFVFAADGDMPDWGEPFSLRDGTESVPSGPTAYVARYRQQLAFVNHKIIAALDHILARTPTPIVIVQSDHGPGSRWDDHSVAHTDHWERMSILNAYFFPDGRYERLYPTITPVNSFRVVFDQYFGEQHALLEDHNYSSPWPHPYEMVDVSQVQRGPNQPMLNARDPG